MIFSNTDLIDQATLVQATRQMASDLIPAGGKPAALSALLSQAQIVAALKLALADLDASDPLCVLRAIDLSAFVGQTEPVMKVSTRHIGNQVVAAYVGELAESNQVPFDIAGAYQVRLHTTLCQPALSSSPTLWVLIRWSRSPQPIPLSERPAALPSFADARCVVSDVTSDPHNLLNTDGVSLVMGDRCLVCLGTGSNAARNGLYTVTDAGLQRASDASNASDFSIGKLVQVAEGEVHADTVWQVTRGPIQVGDSPIVFTRLDYPTNLDAAQATAHVIPRAAAYLVAQYSVQVSDKNQAQRCADWAAGILARSLPTQAEAISRRAQTATEYATS